MKKTILLLSFTAILLSCKKDKTPAFTATDTTGTSVVKGNINKNVITPNGSGSWTNGTRIPAAGVSVSIKVNKSSLYPNSTAQGADVYTGTTDNNGNYSIQVKTNATGVEAMITIDGFTGTLDTLVNGISRTGQYASYLGTSETTTLFMGQNMQLDYSFTGSPVNTNPGTVNAGSATITGSVSMSIMKETLVGNITALSLINVPVPAGLTVYLNFNKDPSLLATKLYTATTDGNGYYTFNVATVAPGTAGFSSQTATVWIPDYAATRDTIKVNGNRVAGRDGVFGMSSTTQSNVYNGSIKNATILRYTSFTPN